MIWEYCFFPLKLSFLNQKNDPVLVSQIALLNIMSNYTPTFMKHDHLSFNSIYAISGSMGINLER